MVQILDTPGLLGGEGGEGGDQVVEVLRKLDVPAVEQVIAVPLISFGPGPPAFCHSSSAEGRTVGGSADGPRIFTGGHCRAGHGTSWTIQFLRFGGGAAEVFQVYEQDRVQQRRTWNRSLSFLFLRVGEGMMEVLKVLSQNRIQQLRMRSRSPIFKLVEVSKVFAKARVLHQVDFFVT